MSTRATQTPDASSTASSPRICIREASLEGDSLPPTPHTPATPHLPRDRETPPLTPRDREAHQARDKETPPVAPRDKETPSPSVTRDVPPLPARDREANQSQDRDTPPAPATKELPLQPRDRESTPLIPRDRDIEVPPLPVRDTAPLQPRDREAPPTHEVPPLPLRDRDASPAATGPEETPAPTTSVSGLCLGLDQLRLSGLTEEQAQLCHKLSAAEEVRSLPKSERKPK